MTMSDEEIRLRYGIAARLFGSRRRTAPTLEYHQMLQQTFGSSIIAYWPMDETSGTTAFDKSGNGRNGTYRNITLNNIMSPNGRPCPLFSSSDVNIFSSAYNTAFNKSEGAVGGFAKVSSGFWTDGLFHYLDYAYASPTNTIYLRKQSTNYQLAASYTAGGVTEAPLCYMNNSDWFHWMIGWSKSAEIVKLWINGVLVATSSTLGTWSGAFTTAYLGGYNGSQFTWSGNMSDIVTINRMPTDAEALVTATARETPKKITVLGDSISDLLGFRWHGALATAGYNSGWCAARSWGVASQTILSHMATQVVNAANDDADIIIIELGTNDNNAGNMATLQAIVEQGIIDLKASNPRATIYYMNVLPRYADASLTVEGDKSNIRSMIVAACAAQNITCWDTRTDPWLYSGLYLDGVHPNDAGCIHIAEQVAARL